MLETAFTIFLVGMISVFTVLGIVILCAHAVIYITNRMAISDLEEPKSMGLPSSLPESKKISEAHRKVIEATVWQLTNGKGRVEEIERIVY